MGTWEQYGPRFGPESYRKLLLRTRVLQETKPDASRGTAARYTLRRLTFQDEHKAAYARAVDRSVDGDEDVELLEAIVDELNGPVEGSRYIARFPVLQVTLRLDPWSVQRLKLRRAVLYHQLDRPVSRSETFRRIFRQRRFTDGQRARFGDEVLGQIERQAPEVYEELVS